jgi:uncharacterized membrane protein (UPF0127 family)
MPRPALVIAALALLLAGCRSHRDDPAPPTPDAAASVPAPASEPPPVAVPPAAPSASVGEFRVLRVVRDDILHVSGIVVEVASPTAPILGIDNRPDALEVVVGGRVIDVGHVGFGHWIDEGDGRHAGFRASVTFPSPLPADCRELTVRGTVPLVVGLDPQEEIFAWVSASDPAVFEAAHATWTIGPVVPDGLGRITSIRMYGRMDHYRTDFLDAQGRPIPCGPRRGGGGGISGHAHFSGSMWLSGQAPLSAFRVTTFGRTETWTVPLDVTAPVPTPPKCWLVRADGPPSSGTGTVATVEIAETAAKRGVGLQRRARLDDDAGMLFAYGGTPTPHTMWMKDCALALDFAFVRADGVIAQIETLGPGAGEPDAKVPRTYEDEPVPFVLAMNATWFERHGIERGDRIDVSAAMAGVEAK